MACAATIQMNKERHAPLTMYLGQVQADGSVKVIQAFKDVDPGATSCPKLERGTEGRVRARRTAFTSPAPVIIGQVATMTVTLDIVTTAALLFVVATGLLVIFGVLKIINFAHGAFLTVGAYGALVTTAFDLNPWLSFPLAFVTGATVGLLVERLVVRPLYDRPLDAILATWGSAS